MKMNGADRTMTLGGKLSAARKDAGMTQEQLAEKLLVSRQAITKWESGKGMPDIENLKRLSKLLSVSIDYLLDDGEMLDMTVLREPINLDDYPYHRKLSGRWVKKTGQKDLVVRTKYPEAEICYLFANQKLTTKEKKADWILGLTIAPFGIPQLINSIKNTDKDFYLVDDGTRQFLVMVSDEFIESHRLPQKITEKKFSIGEFEFSRSILIPKK